MLKRILGPNRQYVTIGSDNGLAPSRRQAIIWTSADSVHWRIIVALGGDELNFMCGEENLFEMVGANGIYGFWLWLLVLLTVVVVAAFMNECCS